MNEGVRIGVVGAGSLVGKEIIGVLNERSVIVRELVLLSAEPEDEGLLAEGIAEPTFMKMLDEKELENLDIVFFCGRASQTRDWIDLRDELGFVAIDVTDRDQPVEGPRVLAGAKDLSDTGNLAVSPHPISVAAGLVLAALQDVVEIDSYRLGVIQPASEHGQEGINEMYEQTLAVLNVQSTPKKVFSQQVAFNLYTPEDAPVLEEEVAREIFEATGISGAVMVQQGATFHSHTLSLFVSAGNELDGETIREALRRNDYLAVKEPDDLAGTSDAGGMDEIVLGRVSVSPRDPHDLLVHAFSDNLRRSRAINAVMIAEQYVSGDVVTN